MPLPVATVSKYAQNSFCVICLYGYYSLLIMQKNQQLVRANLQEVGSPAQTIRKRLCFDFFCLFIFFTLTILVPNLKPFPIGNHISHIWVSFSAALPQAKLTDRGFGRLLMHRFVIIIVLLKLELEAPWQRQSFRIQIRLWD